MQVNVPATFKVRDAICLTQIFSIILGILKYTTPTSVSHSQVWFVWPWTTLHRNL